jgi:hypothetical protein
MNIIREEEIELYNKKYKQITFENGEQILKKYNSKSKIWVTLKFATEENSNMIANLINIVVKAL